MKMIKRDAVFSCETKNLLFGVRFSPPMKLFQAIALSLVLTSAVSAASSQNSRKQIGRPVPAEAKAAPTGQSLPGAQPLNLAIGVPVRNEDALNKFLADLYNAGSPNFHRYLTPEQFTEQFGPTQTDYQAVIDFATNHGLTVTAAHPNRRGESFPGEIKRLPASA